MVDIGERVRITGMTARGCTGTVTRQKQVLGQAQFVVALDSPFFGRNELRVSWRRLTPLSREPQRFTAGQRVTFANRLFRGLTGTLIRPSRLLWKRAWLVEMDGSARAIRRTRVTERALVPLGRRSPERPA